MTILSLFIYINLTSAFGQSSIDLMLENLNKMNQPGTQTCDRPKTTDNTCNFVDAERKYATDSLQSPEALLMSIKNSSAIYIGETHEEDSFEFYSWILENSKIAGRRSCLTLEIDHDAKAEALEKCNADPEKSFKLNSENQSRFEINCPGAKESIGVPGWRSLAIQAFKLGWEVHAVDERSKCSNEVTLDSVACRNKHMAERITELRQNGCERTVSIFGQLHLVSDARLKSPGVNKLVNDKASRKSLLLQLVPQNDLARSFSKLSDCGYRKPKFLIVSVKGRDTAINSALGHFGSSNQFDSSILLPQQKK